MKLHMIVIAILILLCRYMPDFKRLGGYDVVPSKWVQVPRPLLYISDFGG